MKIAVVGAGLSGATVAAILGGVHDVTVFDARRHVGGNVYTERDPETGILIHKYGPHIFHTADAGVFNFVTTHNRNWNDFRLAMKSNVCGTIYSAPPINLHTINQFYQHQFTPEQARRFITEHEATKLEGPPKNFEEAAVSTIGYPLYHTFLEGYTEKQWGRPATEIPASVYGRLPLRFNYDDNKYPSTEWQMMPADGYTPLAENLLRKSKLVLETKCDATVVNDFDFTFWTGPLDEFFGYRHGNLEYRTLDFEVQTVDERDAQGAPVICFPDAHVQHTRITEHKHFLPSWTPTVNKSVLFYEHPRACKLGDIPFYPVRTTGDKSRLEQYLWLAEQQEKMTFLGRLGTYKYMDMDQAIKEAISAAHTFVRRHSA